MYRYNPFWIMLVLLAVAVWLTGMFRPFRFEPIYPPRGQTDNAKNNKQDVQGIRTVSPEERDVSGAVPLDASSGQPTASQAAKRP